MSKQKKTPWFSGKVKPARPGVYERRYRLNDPVPAYCRFDGVEWFCWAETPREALLYKSTTMFQNLPWRGLTAPAKEAAHG